MATHDEVTIALLGGGTVGTSVVELVRANAGDLAEADAGGHHRDDNNPGDGSVNKRNFEHVRSP